MKLFPVEEFKLTTKSSKDEVISKLYSITIAPDELLHFNLHNSDKYFRGEIFGNTFKLKPKVSILSKRSLVPDIVGVVTTEDGFTVITGTIGLNNAMQVIFPLLYIIPIIFISFSYYELSLIPIMILIALVNYVFIRVSIHSHASKSIGILNNL